MAVSEEKTRVLVTITRKQKEHLDQLAAADKRTISNLCAKILTDYLDELKEGEEN